MIRTDYTFSAVSQTITFVDPVVEENIGIIVNKTDGIIIYNSFDPSATGVLSGLVITLVYDTSLMSDTDVLQIFYSGSEQTVTGPLTDNELRAESIDVNVVSADTIEQLTEALINKLDDSQLFKNVGTGELFTTDLNLANVLGTSSIRDGDSIGAQIKLRRFPRVAQTITGLNSEVKVSCLGANTVAIQLAGTWAGTVTFQASIDGGNFITCQAQPIGGGIAVQSATAVGAWVINCSGFDSVKILYSTYTSGVVMAVLVADVANPPAPNVAFPTTQVTTSTNLDVAFSSTALYVPSHAELGQQIVAPIVNPTQPTTYAANEYSRFPQTLRRLRVQSGGDKNLPFAQEMTTNRILTNNPEQYSILEQILLQLKMLNQAIMLANNVTPPSGWDEIK